MSVRPAHHSEIHALAHLWFHAWRDAHAGIVPVGLVHARTRDSFAERMEAAIADVRVIGSIGTPLGFYMLKDSELYQLYVRAEGRGKGFAAALMADAELLLATNGVETAWLDCALGNERAARFYAKSGWSRVGTAMSHLETASGSFDLEVWRYEKRLAQSIES